MADGDAGTPQRAHAGELAAMAAPFATGSYKVKLYSFREVPMTTEERAGLIAAWGENIEDCKKYELIATQVGCEIEVQALKRGTFRVREPYPSLSKYVAFNGAVMLATLIVTFFALTGAMAVVRKWWRWWW